MTCEFPGICRGLSPFEALFSRLLVFERQRPAAFGSITARSDGYVDTSQVKGQVGCHVGEQGMQEQENAEHLEEFLTTRPLLLLELLPGAF